MKRLFYNACFVSALSAVILPAMYLQGCHWYYLCIVYIFCIGFNNILTTPIILSRMEMKKEPGNRKTSHRVASFLSILLPAILVYGLVEFDKSETYIWFFAVISCVSLLLFKFMVKAIIRLWRGAIK